MSTLTDQERCKRAAGLAGAALIQSGMRVGLGTGSTAAHAIEELGRRTREEGLLIAGVPTSFAAERLARTHGLTLSTLDDVDHLDIALDGADEVDSKFRLIKGRGAALTREKVVASLARRFVVMIDPTKKVEQLGVRVPLPVEVLPMAVSPVSRSIERLDGRPVLRMGHQKDGPVVTDQGFWILDVSFEGIEDPEELDRSLNDLPGVLGHGLFLRLTSDVIVGKPDDTVDHLRA